MRSIDSESIPLIMSRLSAIKSVLFLTFIFWIYQPQSIYPPTKVGGWQTYHAVRFVVPPKLDLESVSEGQKICKLLLGRCYLSVSRSSQLFFFSGAGGNISVSVCR